MEDGIGLMKCCLWLVLESLEKADLLRCQVLSMAVLGNDLEATDCPYYVQSLCFLLFLICFAYTLVNHFRLP